MKLWLRVLATGLFFLSLPAIAQVLGGPVIAPGNSSSSITLTTTGSSGPAALVGGNLNVPVYASSGYNIGLGAGLTNTAGSKNSSPLSSTNTSLSMQVWPNIQTSTYTVQTSDAGGLVALNSTTSAPIYLSSSTTGTPFNVVNINSGALNLTATGGASIKGLSLTSSAAQLAQYGFASCVYDGANFECAGYPATSSGSSVTWPSNGNIVVSNTTNTPAGLAEVDGDCVLGSGGSWVAGSCSGSSSANLGASTTATSPQITGDASSGFYTPAAKTLAVSTSGVEAMQWNTAASGVNYLTVTPAATGAAPILSAGGTDTQGLGLGVAINGITATTTGVGGSISLTAGNGLNATGTGGAVTLKAGTGGASSFGGAINITAGAAGSSSFGGAVNITGGSSSTAGGAINITGGNPGGAIAISTVAASSSAGAAITIAANGVVTNASDNATLSLSSGSASNTGPGANLNITAGSSKGTGSFNGGSVVITPGTATVSSSGVVGMVNIAGGMQSTGTKFTTSGCSISATTGGAQSGTFTLGANSCTAVITLNGASKTSATNGWSCPAWDQTAPTVLIGGNSSSTTTTASFAIPAGAGTTDVIAFNCIGN